MSGQIVENTILTELSSLIARAVSPDDMLRARWHLLDWMGCAVAGAKEPCGQILLNTMRSDWLGRCFAWGGLGNILEMDDVDKRALLHPGPTIIPAALLAAEEDAGSVEAILAAIVRGYEATIRLGRGVGTGHYALFHSTGTCGAIGAAAASASLMGLNPRQTAHAMALAISQSAGLWHTRHDPQSMGKQLHTSAAARAGLQAAQLAEAGFTGPLEILEGEQGFFAALCPDADPGDLLQNASSDWFIHDVSFKPWPACRHAHAAIDAALELKASGGIDPSAEIRVRTYGDALKFCDKPDPKTVIEAKFSLQHAVAVVLARGAPSLRDFEVSAIESPDISRLRSRIQISESDTYTSVYPAHFGAEIEHAGRVIQVVDALGDPENPVSPQHIIDKARMLMRAGELTDDDARALIDLATSGTGSPGSMILNRLGEVLS